MIRLKVAYLKNTFQKSVGLIGATKAYPVYLETRFGIHTFGLKFPIDVLILDEANKIVKMKVMLKPNKFLFWNLKYHKVIELPHGTIKNLNLMVRDSVNLDFIKA